MTKLNTFLFNNKKIIAVLDVNKEPWFKAKNIIKILEYSRLKHAITSHVDNKDKQKLEDIKLLIDIPLSYNENNAIYINKIGLFALILSSKNKEAIIFKKWIIEDMIPLINKKYNDYKINQDIYQQIDLLTYKLETQIKIYKEQLSINKQIEIALLNEIC